MSNVCPSIKLNELFPTKWSAIIFLAYMFLFINQGILVKLSQSNGNTYDFNITSVVLAGELFKLIISITLFLNVEHCSLTALWREFRSGFRICLLYLIPSGLYCAYNNLAFVNLANYDPTTYFILLQFRNVITGIFYQAIFRRKLSKLQWFSLFVLTTGCVVKEIGGKHHDNNDEMYSTIISFRLFLILLQVFCSCFAGVYNEYLLKDSSSSVSIWMQNIYMYIDSIACNLLVIYFLNLSPSSTFSSSTIPAVDCFSFLSQPNVWLILLNGALAGITTSLFLKSLNSILKTFAATLEIVITAILCFFIFGTTIDRYTILSIALIAIAIIIYSHKPVPASSVEQTAKRYNNFKPKFKQITSKNGNKSVSNSSNRHPDRKLTDGNESEDLEIVITKQ